MDAVQKANAGHPGTAMALAPVAYLLYAEVMRHDPADAGLAGPRPLRPLGGARLHPPVRLAPPVGLRPDARRPAAVPAVGLADARVTRSSGTRRASRRRRARSARASRTASGIAIAQRFLADRYNRPHHAIVDSWVYAICSDGDLMEGVTQEAASIAGHLGLGRLVYVYDDNHITIDGTTTITLHDARTRASASRRTAGTSSTSTTRTTSTRCAPRSRRRAPRTARPSLIVAPHPHRLPGAARDRHGEGARRARSARTRCARRRRCSAWTRTSTFVVPDAVREHMAGCRRARRGSRARRGRSASTPGRDAHPDAAADRELDLAGTPRDGWREALPVVRGRRGDRDARRRARR